MSQNDFPRRISVSEMAPHIHSFNVGENKVAKISAWLINWINLSLESGKIKPLDFLPTKGSLAFHIGVSLGTMQNVYRVVEDEGLIESKQKVGTYIKDNAICTEKLTSKREGTCEIIKGYIISQKYKEGDKLKSIRKISSEINVPNTTVRIAINTLIKQGIIERNGNDFIVKNIKFEVHNIEIKNLADKIAERIKSYVKKNCKSGDKLPSNSSLASMFNVSIKTVHDAVRILEGEGILKSRRGYYGTIVLSQDSTDELYRYEKVEYKIRGYITVNASEGDKLPSIREFSRMYGVSTKTIKNALDNLAYDGYITFSRGRNGGTFVLEVPQAADKNYTWLAINPDFVSQNEH